ncbi:hypothetical protein [Singulisphaera sp. PoT]|uniref:hypothetical protein n=1 Tax=Singulisphaera sp. PoT TaxID=3411797 RepID=UPI003BF50C53
MDDFMAVLRREFEADEGSFLLTLRVQLEWERASFSRLVRAMELCAMAYEGRGDIEQWVANGFWYMEQFVPDWSSSD